MWGGRESMTWKITLYDDDEEEEEDDGVGDDDYQEWEEDIDDIDQDDEGPSIIDLNFHLETLLR